MKKYLLGLCLIALANLTFAQETKIFDNDGGDGLWSTAENWDPNGVPSEGDDVVIPSNATVFYDTPTSTVNSLLVDPPTTGSTGGFGSVVRSGLLINDGNVLNVEGEFQFNGGANEANITLLIFGNDTGEGSQLSIGGDFVLNAPVNASAVIDMDNGGASLLEVGGDFLLSQGFGTLLSSDASKVTFNGTENPSQEFPLGVGNINYNDIDIAGDSVYLNENSSQRNIAGTLRVLDGAIFNNNSISINLLGDFVLQHGGTMYWYGSDASINSAEGPGNVIINGLLVTRNIQGLASDEEGSATFDEFNPTFTFGEQSEIQYDHAGSGTQSTGLAYLSSNVIPAINITKSNNDVVLDDSISITRTFSMSRDGRFRMPNGMSITKGDADVEVHASGTIYTEDKDGFSDVSYASFQGFESGDFLMAWGTVVYDGTIEQSISNQTTYFDLILDNPTRVYGGTPWVTIDNIYIEDLITIKEGTQFDMGDSEYHIGGDWINNGVVNADSSSILFMDDIDQTIDNGGYALKNIEVNKGGGTVSLVNVDTIRTPLTLTSGNLNLGSTLLDLDSTYIAPEGTGDITGGLTFKKTLSHDGYTYLTSPVSTSLGDITGSSAWQGMYHFDESAREPDNPAAGWTWVDYNDDIIPGEGYAIYYSSSQPLVVDGNYEHSPSGSTAKPVQLSHTPIDEDDDGWNLIGNPWMTDLDWDAVQKNNVESGIYFWNGEKYVGYNNEVGGSDATLPPLQGFMARATEDGASVVFDRATDAVSNSSELKRKAALAKVYKVGVSSGEFSDESFIRFSPEATDGYESFIDLEKLKNLDEYPSLYTELKDTNYYINAVADIKEPLSLPLILETKFEGDYTFTGEVTANFPADWEITLKDKATGAVTFLNEETYTVSLDSTTYDDRFYLNFNAESTPLATFGTEDKSLVIGSDMSDIILNKKGGSIKDAEVIVLDISGRELYRGSTEIAGSVNIPVQISTSGIYIVKVISADNIYSEKVFLNK